MSNSLKMLQLIKSKLSGREGEEVREKNIIKNY